MQVLHALTALSLSIGSPANIEPLSPVFSMAVEELDAQREDTQDDEGGYNPQYYRMKKSGKSGWGGASCKHPLNRRPYTI